MDKEPDYPERVFENEDLSYTEAIEAFVVASQEKEKESSPPKLSCKEKESLLFYNDRPHQGLEPD